MLQRLGEGGDTTIPSSERSPKQPLPGIGLHDPLHGRQACPEFNSFHQGVGQISPREGFFRAVPSQNEDKFVTSPRPPIVERLTPWIISDSSKQRTYRTRLLSRGEFVQLCIAFESAHKKLIGAALLGLPSQCKVQIPSQPKSFKTERYNHFSRLSLLVQALPCSTTRTNLSK